VIAVNQGKQTQLFLRGFGLRLFHGAGRVSLPNFLFPRLCSAQLIPQLYRNTAGMAASYLWLATARNSMDYVSSARTIGRMSVEVSMGKLFPACVLLSVFIAIGHLSHAQSRAQPSPSKGSNEAILSGKDWKLGSFEMGDGEKQGAFLPDFDDHAFRTVGVPGEVQLQIGLHGMDIYYQSKNGG